MLRAVCYLRTYTLAQEFKDAFRERNGSLLCRDILDADVRTPEGIRMVRAKDLFRTVCPKFVKDAGRS